MAKKKIIYNKINKISIKKLGLAIGLTWALGMFLTSLSSWLFDYGTSWVELINDVYIGYAGSLIGSITGALYGFIDGFILGILIAWIYNNS